MTSDLDRPRLDVIEARIEARIERIRQDSAEVADDLLLIHDHQLWAEGFPSFEAYCSDRWDIGRTHSYRLLNLGRVRQSPLGTRVTVESHARVLAPLLADGEALVATWDRAARAGEVTARSLAAALPSSVGMPADEGDRLLDELVDTVTAVRQRIDRLPHGPDRARVELLLAEAIEDPLADRSLPEEGPRTWRHNAVEYGLGVRGYALRPTWRESRSLLDALVMVEDANLPTVGRDIEEDTDV